VQVIFNSQQMHQQNPHTPRHFTFTNKDGRKTAASPGSGLPRAIVGHIALSRHPILA
jgi:hypothetical protein